MSQFTVEDVLAIEQGDDEHEAIVSLQRAINSGTGWALQGSYGRAMMHAIEAGQCLLGKSGCRDYWGNYIPSRDEVEAGTKGSYDYVCQHSGVEHADAMREV